MFIRWRTYQRQYYGVKSDEQIRQAIIVKSYRGTKAALKKTMPLALLAEAWKDPDLRKKLQRPRHRVIARLPSFNTMMISEHPQGYYGRGGYWRDALVWTRGRLLWWEHVDKIMAKLAERQPDCAAKLTRELEAVVPRVKV